MPLFRKPTEKKTTPPTADDLKRKGKKFEEVCKAIEELPLEETDKKWSKEYGKKILRKRVRETWDEL